MFRNNYWTNSTESINNSKVSAFLFAIKMVNRSHFSLFKLKKELTGDYLVDLSIGILSYEDYGGIISLITTRFMIKAFNGIPF